MALLFTFVLIWCALFKIADSYTYRVNYTSLDTPYSDSLDRNETHTFIFTSVPGTLQLTTELNTPNKTLFVSIQYLDVLQSASVPTLYQSYSQVEYLNRTARTLCVDAAGVLIRVLFESDSLTPVSFSLSLRRVRSNRLHLDAPSSTLVSPSEPNFFSYQIDSHYFDIILSSQTNLCCFISIQEGVCPSSARIQVMVSLAYTMTMRTDASLTLRRDDFNSDNLLIVINGVPGESCGDTTEYSSNQTAENYSKNVSVMVTGSASPTQYWSGIMFSIFIFFFPYLLLGSYLIFELYLTLQSTGHRSRYLFFTIGLPSLPPECPEASTDPENSLQIQEEMFVPKQKDLLEPRIIAKYRSKMDKFVYIDYSLKLPTQHTKRSSHLKNKFNSYVYFILVLFIFYGMPAVQIAFDQLDQLASSRNQDLCYYNFRCERRVNSIRAFNNLLSNGAYVSYGVLFLILVCVRHISYNIRFSKHPEMVTRGVPYFFGVYYAMSVALIAEGVMSTLYHTCPTRANYQFDISFMFVMLTLIMVRLFQQRHPDGSVKAVTTFLLISCAIGLSSIGLWQGDMYFYSIRIIYLLLIILFSGIFVVSIYYFGMPNMCLVLLYDIFIVRKPVNQIDAKKLLLAFKHNHARFFQIGCFLVANILVVSLMFSRRAIPDFPSVILYTFIFNFAFYFLYYWIMKFIKQEFKHRPHVFIASFLLFIFSVICWMFALAFYFNKVKQWRETPSASRVRNEDCVLLDFYDNHDLWHFLSALALFSMYVSIFVIDDNILFVKRENIDIF